MRARWQPRFTDVAECWWWPPMTAVRPQTLESEFSHARAPKCRSLVRDQQNRQQEEPAREGSSRSSVPNQQLVAEDWGGDTVMVR